jgi:hypothetical protein
VVGLLVDWRVPVRQLDDGGVTLGPHHNLGSTRSCRQ